MEKGRKNENDAKSSQTKDKKSIGTMNIILIVVGVALFAFTVEMIRVFLVYGAIPDTLCTCVFAALGGECGVMGMIKTAKEKYKDREWQQEDKQEAARAERSEPVNLEDRPEPPDIGN